MLTYRVIPCLLLNNGGLVKTRKFKNGVYVGDPINAIRIFNEKEVDELVLLDIRASLDKSGPNFDLLKEIASECFMPLAYGGGITSIEQIRALLRLGIEKIILNTALNRDPNFVREAVATFGSQAITASIDVQRKLFGRYEVMTFAGTEVTGHTAVEAARRAEQLGVGEILLTSIDAEGSMEGYDIALLSIVSQSVSIPVIASGGAGKLEDFRSAVRQGHVSAVAAGTSGSNTKTCPTGCRKRSKRSWLLVGAEPNLPFGLAQLTLRMLAGGTAILTCLLRMLSSTITRPSASAIW